MICVLAAIVRLLYAVEGTVAHYTIHFDIPLASYMSAGVGIVVAIGLLLPLSRRLAILFTGISVISGIVGFAMMSWIYLTEGETNPLQLLLWERSYSPLFYT